MRYEKIFINSEGVAECRAIENDPDVKLKDIQLWNENGVGLPGRYVYVPLYDFRLGRCIANLKPEELRLGMRVFREVNRSEGKIVSLWTESDITNVGITFEDGTRLTKRLVDYDATFLIL